MARAAKSELDRHEILVRLAENSALLHKHQVKRIGLFGSYARNEQKKKSDIDFLVEFETPTFDNFMELAFAFERLFRKKVDLVIPESLSPYLRPKVEREVYWIEV